MTPPTRREHIAAIRERDAKGGDLYVEVVADRRYLLGVVGELEAALRGVMVVKHGPFLSHDPYDGDERLCRCVAHETVKRVLADLGPDE